MRRSGALISGSAEEACLDQERGWRNGGIWDVTILLKMSAPTRAVSRAKRRRPAANWHRRRCILSVPQSSGAPGASHPVNHLCSRSILPTRLFDTLSEAWREEI